MNGRGRLALALVALAVAPTLGGCVAAALPVLAATGVLGTQMGDGKDEAEAPRAPRVSVDLAPTDRMTGAPATSSAVDAAPLAQPASVPAASGKIYELDDGTRVQLVSAPLSSPAASTPTGFPGYDGLYAYATEQGTLPPAGSERRSAFLADPGALAPVTRECSIHPAAVLVDLDPAAGVLDPATAAHADPAFASRLAALREAGVIVAWISGNTADRAGAVRKALVASGLDPAGRDELALLRYPEERKQTRRQDLGKEYCVVAIAGDERGDFDELFQYLKDPARAGPLDRLIGAGWFLIPQPLS